jgi:hypothetical protein
MRAFTRKTAQANLVRALRSTHTQIKPLEIQGLFNFRCHENSVQYVRDNPSRLLEVVETIYLDGGEPALHYLVRDKVTGDFLEVTLGWRTRQLEYYMTRALLPGDLDHIHSEFSRSLDHWRDLYVSPVARVLLRIDRIL